MDSSLSSPSKKHKYSKDAFAQDLLLTTSGDSDLINEIPQTPLNDFDHGSGSSDDIGHGSEDSDDIDEVLSNYDPEDLSDLDDIPSYDDTLSLQAQFDASDLPPGVEASVPWLEEELAKTQKKQAATSSPSTSGQVNEEEDDQVLEKFRLFKKFDVVEDFSDHHYYNSGRSHSLQASRNWTKTIHHQWTLLEKDLPDSIFVRVSEERMDLMRAVIIGAAGTPYHDGLFFFDLLFPPEYPNVPPQVYYHSGGLRLNPNLYNSGKVCLSLLNTWSGPPWTPGESTVLQVLVSIQALVLNEKPFFNEPGFEHLAGGREGERRSRAYNWNTFVLSCKTMLYSLRRPPKYFEDLIAGHFRERGETILEACKAYIKGIEVGCPIEGEVQPVEKADITKAENFKLSLRTVVASLVPAFIKNGAKECERFIPLGDVNRTVALKL